VTPSTEPVPELAVDRLVEVTIPPEARGAVRVVLRGACSGTMADLGNLTTCVDTQGVLAAAPTTPLDPDLTLPSTSLQGTFDADVPCSATPRPPGSAADGTPLYDLEVCVDGTLFVLGSPDGEPPLSDLPQRVAFVPPLRIDAYEVTVARYRAAIAAGFVSPDLTPVPNEGPLPTSFDPMATSDFDQCTWSVSAQGREDYPVNCISQGAARDFCLSIGGDLPTEAQWEYVSAVAGRPYRSRYPWGGDDSVIPLCPRAVYGRGGPFDDDDCACPNGDQPCGYGPASVTTNSGDGGDVTPLGVHGMGGSMSELVLDSAAMLGANCWLAAPIVSPSCTPLISASTALRGGNWELAFEAMAAAHRDELEQFALSTGIGFRCVRSGTGP
jgi:formylglycine-generating enzyme required for sulfatase activity